MAGRPRKIVDAKQVENYAKLGCSDVDIAQMLMVSARHIKRHFAELLEKSRAERRTVIRGWQYEAAKKGNVTMMIWLGKQELGQSDKAENMNKGQHTIIMKEGGIDSTPRSE